MERGVGKVLATVLTSALALMGCASDSPGPEGGEGGSGNGSTLADLKQEVERLRQELEQLKGDGGKGQGLAGGGGILVEETEGGVRVSVKAGEGLIVDGATGALEVNEDYVTTDELEALGVLTMSGMEDVAGDGLEWDRATNKLDVRAGDGLVLDDSGAVSVDQEIRDHVLQPHVSSVVAGPGIEVAGTPEGDGVTVAVHPGYIESVAGPGLTVEDGKVGVHAGPGLAIGPSDEQGRQALTLSAGVAGPGLAYNDQAGALSLREASDYLEVTQDGLVLLPAHLAGAMAGQGLSPNGARLDVADAIRTHVARGDQVTTFQDARNAVLPAAGGGGLRWGQDALSVDPVFVAAQAFGGGNVLVVGKGDGAPFATIGAAIAEARRRGVTANNPYVVLVGPGTYTEAVELPPGLHLRGFGQDLTGIRPAADETPLVTGHANASISDVSVHNSSQNIGAVAITVAQDNLERASPFRIIRSSVSTYGAIVATAISADGDVSVEYSDVWGGSTGSGVGISVRRRLTVRNSTIDATGFIQSTTLTCSERPVQNVRRQAVASEVDGTVSANCGFRCALVWRSDLSLRDASCQ